MKIIVCTLLVISSLYVNAQNEGLSNEEFYNKINEAIEEQSAGNLNNAISIYKSLVLNLSSITDKQITEYVYQDYGVLFYNQAAALITSLNNMNTDDYVKNSKNIEFQIKELFYKAIPLLEKAHETSVDRQSFNKTVTTALLTIYRKLNQTEDYDRLNTYFRKKVHGN